MAYARERWITRDGVTNSSTQASPGYGGHLVFSRLPVIEQPEKRVSSAPAIFGLGLASQGEERNFMRSAAPMLRLQSDAIGGNQ